MRFNALITTVVCMVGATSASGQGALWQKSIECFNSEDFACAYQTATELFFSQDVVVGSDDRTTDSMAYFTRALIEAGARATDDEKAGMLGYVMFHQKLTSPRLPFFYGLGTVILADACRSKGANCATRFEREFCSIALPEMPKPYWGELEGTNPISETGHAYFQRVWADRPDCEEV